MGILLGIYGDSSFVTKYSSVSSSYVCWILSQLPQRAFDKRHIRGHEKKIQGEFKSVSMREKVRCQKISFIPTKFHQNFGFW